MVQISTTHHCTPAHASLVAPTTARVIRTATARFYRVAPAAARNHTPSKTTTKGFQSWNFSVNKGFKSDSVFRYLLFNFTTLLHFY